MGKNGLTGLLVELRFVQGVEALDEIHKIAARLHGTAVRFHETSDLICEGLRFKVTNLFRFRRTGPPKAVAQVWLNKDTIPVEDIGKLMSLLFERRVLYPVITEPDYVTV